MGAKTIIGTAVVVLIASYVYYEATRFDPASLEGVKVVVTGASSGIGRQVALQYAQYGADVFITARREKLLQQTLADMRAVGRKGATFAYTTANMENYANESKRVIQEAVKSLRGLDHLVLNHAFVGPEVLHKWTGSDEEIRSTRRQFDIGFFSYLQLTNEALPHLLKSAAARISVVGSLCGKTTYRGLLGYVSMKFALDGFYGSLREQFENDDVNIKVTYNVIGPVDVGKEYPDVSALFDHDRMMFLTPVSTVEPAAYHIVRGTALGQAEMYYPDFLGFVPGGYRIFPILRHIKHNLFYVSS